MFFNKLRCGQVQNKVKVLDKRVDRSEGRGRTSRKVGGAEVRDWGVGTGTGNHLLARCWHQNNDCRSGDWGCGCGCECGCANADVRWGIWNVRCGLWRAAEPQNANNNGGNTSYKNKNNNRNERDCGGGISKHMHKIHNAHTHIHTDTRTHKWHIKQQQLSSLPHSSAAFVLPHPPFSPSSSSSSAAHVSPSRLVVLVVVNYKKNAKARKCCCLPN